MAAVKLLLNQARRHSLTTANAAAVKPHSHLRSLMKSLSTESNPDPIPNPNPQRQSPLPIQPVSYELKPKPEARPPQPPPPETDTSFTKEDFRYLKDASVSSSSSSLPVAPLPEDRADVSKEDMDIESKRIEYEAKQKLFRMQQEEEGVKVPFPTLIRGAKKEKKPLFDLKEVLKLVKVNAKAKFDETVEMHVKLGINSKRSDLIVRGAVTLPHGASKAARVAVFAEGLDADEARAAGADIVGGVELIEEIAKSGKINFEKCFTTQQFMPRVFKISKILNKHGLMPNPKLGTVTSNFSRAVKEAQKNQVKFKMDDTANVHVGLGKVSFTEAALRENTAAFMYALLQAKPAGLNKTSKYAGYIDSVSICSTMGQAFPVSVQSLAKAENQYSRLLVN
ncbi:hypothetical protein ACFE04_016583 [Oxalis oulophora]